MRTNSVGSALNQRCGTGSIAGQNIPPPFSITMCDPPRIHPSLPEYTPLLFNNYNIMRPSQNLPLLPRIYPPPFSTNWYVRPSQNLPLPTRIYPPPFQRIDICDPSRIYSSSQNIPPFQQMHMCDSPSIYPSLPEYTPLFNNYVRPSQNLPLPPRMHPSFNN